MPHHDPSPSTEKRTRLGEALRQYRLNAGLTQAALGEMAQVNRDYISSLEAGRIQVVYPETFERLKAVLGFPSWVLLEAMGYSVSDAPGRPAQVPRRVSPPLLAAIAALTEGQQRALFTFVMAMRRPHANGEDEPGAGKTRRLHGHETRSE